ncbi:LacI family DNA-binding transcriptional regulator [Conexibacter woesei]|uniref:Transcriptional regulator, LacI family n=1 Tax=Conexibacter woesei (strain DSM 14684 / CCUG 47730 / CIP 108061 / JCM 11494 / NBRC 100937 / ID131577) TaxID=469383 RepID=D3FA51_CONWI|nr:LacI family DNA-binding transcriptional regulator [Conexibacter woesei]ADB53146.1 transcriptional regulator, LacI family [Conexibacter woesei DSM 14684]
MSRPAAPRVTIRDVAAAAGVSVTTVSHSLNGKGAVDPATRARVKQVAAQLGYRASRAAQALRAGRSGTIAFVIPSVGAVAEEREMLSLDYYMQLASAAARVAFTRRHPLLLPPPIETLDDLRELGVDGAILCDPARDDPRIALFEELGLPIVTIERDLGRPDHRWYVEGDNRGNMRLLLDHVAAAGGRRIALLSADSTWSWSADNEQAYRAWCEEHERTPIVEPTSLRHLETSAYDRACALLDRPDRPDAIIALAERYATGVVRAARERGLRIPQDLLVAGGIDSHQAAEGDPPITAIDLQPELQGAAAAALLVALTEGERPEAPRIVPSRLRVRASTQRT